MMMGPEPKGAEGGAEEERSGKSAVHSTGTWCHRSSDQPSVAVLSQLLVQRPGAPCWRT